MGKRIDLTGQKFGELTALYIDPDNSDYWICQCSCGRVKSIRGYELRKGRIKSCGTCSKLIDLTNKKFGEWTALEYVGNRKWKCQCSCGKIRVVSSYELRSGKSTSCGHNTNGFKDITGQKFGDWTVLKYLGNQMWLCQCKCGELAEHKGSTLRLGRTHSCKKCAALIDLTGKHFGEWEVIKKSDRDDYWTCKCSCGTIRDVHGYSLRSGKSTSCGCDGKKTAQQLDIFSSIPKLKLHIESLERQLGHKPSSYEVADSLGVNYNSVNRKIREQDDIKELMSVGIKHTSSYETDMVAFIKPLCPDVQQNIRGIIGGQELDIWIPSKRLAIEINGSYWHSSIYKDKYYHQKKTMLCINNGIRLIHIADYELDNNKDKVYSFIQDVITDNKPTIYGRNTKVVEIGQDKSREFLEKYHLQGYIAATINLGLEYNGELVGVMTFGKPRFIVGFDYEVLRLAFKNGVAVVGGAEKLFSYFIEKTKANTVISYVDISKFTGEVYNRLGFEISKREPITQPNYVWIKPGGTRPSVLSRYKTTKEKLVQAGLDRFGNTEDEIMENLGYYKLYNCGNIRYEWRKQNVNA